MSDDTTQPPVPALAPAGPPSGGTPQDGTSKFGRFFRSRAETAKVSRAQTAIGQTARGQTARGQTARQPAPRLEQFKLAAADKQRRAAMVRTRGRIVIATFVFASMFAVVGFRVTWVTVINPVEAKMARLKMPRLAEEVLPPIEETLISGQRAMIVDRTGQPLAMSRPTRSVFADPAAIGDAAEAVRRLKTVLPRLDETRAVKRLSDRSKRFVYLERQITPDEEARINNLGIPSVDFRPTQQRHYPMGRVAAHVVGGVDIDEGGQAGVELAFDKEIRERRDPLRLSLDIRVQNVVREELMAAKEAFRAIGAAGIVMDVNTGEVLAMVSLPDFDANDRVLPVSDEKRFNRAITGNYEPGSTFKLQTLSMALDTGAAHLWDSFDAANDIHIGRFTISDFEGKHRSLTFPEVLAYSSNLGAARIARLVGGERQRAWLKNMGMFNRVGIELREAARPQVHSVANWGEAVNLTVGFGHGISVTPLHVVAGTAAIANGGVRMKPTILMTDPMDPPEGIRVMRPSTSDAMKRLMRLVVTSGFGKKAEVAGYYPGGKTGTAEKNSGHGYKRHANVSAFMSVFPMHAPRYAVYMMLDEPHGTAATGGYATAGWVAAPAAGKVIGRIGPILGLLPEIKEKAAIDQALAIPMHPPRGLVPGPIRIIESRPEPSMSSLQTSGRPNGQIGGQMRATPIPARIPARTEPANTQRRTQNEPVRDFSVPIVVARAPARASGGGQPVVAISTAVTVAPH